MIDPALFDSFRLISANPVVVTRETSNVSVQVLGPAYGLIHDIVASSETLNA